MGKAENLVSFSDPRGMSLETLESRAKGASTSDPRAKIQAPRSENA